MVVTIPSLFLESDTPNPQEPHAISKHEAGQGLYLYKMFHIKL
jgi:hypothetical protein